MPAVPPRQTRTAIDPSGQVPIIPPHFSSCTALIAPESRLRRSFVFMPSVMIRSTLPPRFAEQLFKGPYLSNSRFVVSSRPANRANGLGGKSAMKAHSFHFVCVTLTVLAVSGCQSGPRWAQMPQKLAWWKKDAPAAADNSLVARSAEGVTPAEPSTPVLPSTQATPQSLTAQASPPSANSVATPTASIAATSVPPLSTIPASSAATIAAAPTATYPSAAATIPATTTAPHAPAADSSVVTATPMTIAATPVAQVGPYDPNAYQPAAAMPAATTVAATQSSSTESDRYGTATAPAADERYAYNSMPAAPATSSTGDDRYGITTAAPAPAPAAAIPPTTTAPAPPAFSPPPITPVGMNPAPAPTHAVATATAVRIDAPAGQYRPGGTSTYTGVPTTNVEVASLPAATTPGTSAKPLPSNVPIYPTGNTTGRAY